MPRVALQVALRCDHSKRPGEAAATPRSSRVLFRRESEADAGMGQVEVGDASRGVASLQGLTGLAASQAPEGSGTFPGQSVRVLSGGLDDRPPLGDLGLDELLVLGSAETRVADDDRAERFLALDEVRVLQRRAKRGVDLVGDRLRRSL